MNSEDDKGFRDLLGDDVRPIKTAERVKLDKRERDAQTLEKRREAAAQLRLAEHDPLAEPLEMVEPLAELSFRRPGVQHGVFRNLRLGKYAADARLDLHRMTVDQARREVFQFVRDCLANDVRSALITHGKGELRQTPALLKSCVAHWLPQLPEVLAFHTALKQHGGYGATYVLFKKSERQKQITKEQHSRRP